MLDQNYENICHISLYWILGGFGPMNMLDRLEEIDLSQIIVGHWVRVKHIIVQYLPK